MHKTLLFAGCALLLACQALFLTVPPATALRAAIVLLIVQPSVVVAAVLLLGLWAAWPLLRHIGRRALLVLACFGLAMTTTACSTLGGLTGPGGSPGNVQQVVANIKAFNDAASTGPCVGYGNVDWQPPLPPSGALHVQCFIGNPQVMTLKQLGAGGSFGGAGATATIPGAPAVTPAPVAPQ